SSNAAIGHSMPRGTVGRCLRREQRRAALPPSGGSCRASSRPTRGRIRAHSFTRSGTPRDLARRALSPRPRFTENAPDGIIGERPRLTLGCEHLRIAVVGPPFVGPL